MLSPKMQRSVRVNDAQLQMLADRAQYDHSMVSRHCGCRYTIFFLSN